ncbi:MAG: hypothetical protein IT384_11100 [Deltaproteobacteria bacterium]|nr:hypothetical protein [Deltaproteobacteria bacterium]
MKQGPATPAPQATESQTPSGPAGVLHFSPSLVQAAETGAAAWGGQPRRTSAATKSATTPVRLAIVVRSVERDKQRRAVIDLA